MSDHSVVIAGGGPTGPAAPAAELALAHVDAVIVERSTAPDPDRARAGGLHAPTIEVLDQRGVADRFLAAGKVMQIQGFGRTPLDISDFLDCAHPYGLAIPQIQTERLLARRDLAELGVPTMREREVTGFAQDDAGVHVSLSDGSSIRATYRIGCDGGRSVVRRLPASSSRAGNRRRAGSMPRSRLPESRSSASVRAVGIRAGRGRREDRIRVVSTEREGRARRRAHAAGRERRTHRHRRDRLRRAYADLELALHGQHPPGSDVSPRTGPSGAG